MALNDRLTGRIVTLAFVFALFAITLWHLLYQSQYDVFNLVPSPLYAFGVIRYLFLVLSVVILCFMMYACINSHSHT